MVLKHLKPVLDEIVDLRISSDVYKECEVLDVTVNEAREFMENWYPRMSKIWCVSNSLIRIFCLLDAKCFTEEPPKLREREREKER